MTPKTRSPLALEIIAWIGTVLILAGYGLFSVGLLPDVSVYHALNLVGSLTVGAISLQRRVWQVLILNCSFALFAAVALLRGIM